MNDDLTYTCDVSSAERFLEMSDAEAGLRFKARLRDMLEYIYWTRAHPDEAATALAALERFKESLTQRNES